MSSAALQPTLTDLGTPLSEVTFCVVDLETTGSTGEDSITEIGAVKVRGGEVLGEFQTLVNPRTAISPLVAVLTGITNQMVAGAPRLEAVLGQFLTFCGDAVLVAHNASFDVGFLKRACVDHDQQWPNPTVVDTVALARTVLLRDEVPNCKLGTLARHFGAGTTPNHRALADARATVDVLHGLIMRIGNLGVGTIEDLLEFTRKVSPQRRAKRSWAKDLPDAPGVYWFVGEDGKILYVGKATSIRTRVRSYFTAAETRRRMDEMVRIATGVQHLVCETTLQAEVCELRMIATHAPPYNRRSKYPHRLQWLKITDEPYPRLSLVRTVRDDDATYFGPFRGRVPAEDVTAALHDAFPIRQCTQRLAKRPTGSRCVLAELGRCLAPCDGSVAFDTYASTVEQLRTALTSDIRPVLSAVRERLSRLVSQERFEEAETIRRRLQQVIDTARRFHRIASLAAVPQIVAARSSPRGWEITVIRYGRLAQSALARPGEVPQAVARAAVATAETVAAPAAPLPAASVEEVERIGDWLEQARIIDIEGDWVWPLHATIAPSALPALALAPGTGQPRPIEAASGQVHRSTPPRPTALM
ncbi:DEDD exonuclease domain-containing protein [Propionibacteriaceae bacterium Y1685]|uniref:DEDD exonuclease domain-containing protein n=1 Tax=Microlunatus sp. Y1700 TaxID=3418487 RepID=UPI003B7CDF57